MVVFEVPLFIFAFPFLASFTNSSIDGSILSTQRRAWHDSNNALSSWDPTLDNPCSWMFVMCDNENYVTRLDLVHAGISGPLVPELGGLKKLQYLELFGNGLNGSIPTTLGNLSNLVSLDLQDNLLSGTIPSCLGSISTLKNLRLNGNNLTGAIPPSLGNLTNLVNLELQNNSLTGSIPASLGNVKMLRFLRLNRNMLTGTVPVEILSLASAGKLTELNVENNHILVSPVISDGSRVNNRPLFWSIGSLSFWSALPYLALI